MKSQCYLNCYTEALIEVYFWTLSIVWCPKTKKITDKELKTPKKTKIQTTEKQT
jgi:hypothetical protein